MGGVIAILQAAVEPASAAGLVLTASALPWTRGGFPHPAVMGAFAMYDTPRVGDRFARMRMRRMDPEQVVRFGYRMVMADPSSLPEEIVRLNVDLVRERQDDTDAPDAFLDAARSMLRLGKRPQVSARALDGVAMPRARAARPAGSIRSAGVRGSRARRSPDVAGTDLPRPGTRSAIGGPRALAGGGRRLVRRVGGLGSRHPQSHRSPGRPNRRRCADAIGCQAFHRTCRRDSGTPLPPSVSTARTAPDGLSHSSVPLTVTSSTQRTPRSRNTGWR